MDILDRSAPGRLKTRDAGGGPKLYRAGTLTYTAAGLATLAFWLLWGDFCITIMEVVWQSIVPLKIKELGAPNWIIGVIMVSIPQIPGLSPCGLPKSRKARGGIGGCRNTAKPACCFPKTPRQLRDWRHDSATR